MQVKVSGKKQNGKRGEMLLTKRGKRYEWRGRKYALMFNALVSNRGDVLMTEVKEGK